MNRTVFFQQLFDSIADRGRELIGRVPTTEDRSADSLSAQCRALLTQTGEASAAALAQNVIRAYGDLDQDERRRFFAFLADELSPDPAAVARVAAAYCQAPTVDNLAALVRVTEPPRQELFRRMNMASGGTATLVGLRAALLDELEQSPALRVVDDDLLHLFSSWFNRGFLTLERVNWRAPALLLEKLIRYEAVHAIRGWQDLRRRLAADRRCFAFFHPALPDEPLIFVEVALVEGISASIEPLIDPDDEPRGTPKADTAIFYSISNCQKGLRGVSFGSFLIKQVAAELRDELPLLTTFATLSPVPGFRRWLAAQGDDLPALARMDPPFDDLGQIMARLDQIDRQGELEPADDLRRPMLALCANYLLHAKRADGLPLDPVARFHLGNGARLERINWRGDVSAKGLQQSAGIMVNSLYQLDQLEHNHEAFVNRHHVVAARSVTQLARVVQRSKAASVAPSRSRLAAS
jgi:malonyl-CoA decarboxylase